MLPVWQPVVAHWLVKMGCSCEPKLTIEPHEHVLPEQICPAGHLFPHAPQFVAEVAVWTQAFEQFVVGAGQLVTHAPFAHATGHVVPHCPQFFGSTFVSTHREEHDDSPGAHAALAPESPPPSGPAALGDRLVIHARMQATSSASSELAPIGIGRPHAGFGDASLSIR